MKTGIIRRIDELGRVVIPKDIRRELKIVANDPLEMGVCNGYIILAPYIPDNSYGESLNQLIKQIEMDEFAPKTCKDAMQHLCAAMTIMEGR